MIRLAAALWLLFAVAAPAQAGPLWLNDDTHRPFRVQPAPYYPSAARAATEGPERWTKIALDLIVKYQQNPLRAARALALLHAAMDDAAVLAVREQLPEAVALHRAAGLTLAFLYPQEADGKYEGLGLALAMAANPSAEAFAAASRIGEEVAERAMGRAMADGAGRRWQLAERPAPRPGLWRASPPLNVYDPAEPMAGTWRTWVLVRGDELGPPPPPAHGSPQWRAELEDVLQVTRSLGPKEKAIAERWNLDHGSVTPPGVWNLVALDLAAAGNFDLSRTSAMLATLNAAMMDAFIACWHAKFAWWTERPVTALRERLDPQFLPHLVTPPFPSYISGHATVSGAAQAVLASYFPERAAWLEAQAEEAAHSRLLGGIHFRSDNAEGLALGRRIGARVVARLSESARAQDPVDGGAHSRRAARAH